MNPPAATQRTLSTADERREEILVAAERVFAARGLHGTPTMEIAKAAGISQAYLFRLFPTKAQLFTALVQRCNDRIHATMARAAGDAKAADPEITGDDVLNAMGQAYIGLLEDRNLLLVQLHSHGASDDPAIREQMRTCFARLVALVEQETQAEPDKVREFFAHGMLLNVLAAMNAGEVDAHWAKLLIGPPKIDG